MEIKSPVEWLPPVTMSTVPVPVNDVRLARRSIVRQSQDSLADADRGRGRRRPAERSVVKAWSVAGGRPVRGPKGLPLGIHRQAVDEPALRGLLPAPRHETPAKASPVRFS